MDKTNYNILIMKTCAFILLYIKASLAVENNEIDMIVDVVKYFDRPTYVAAMTIWKPNLQLQFANSLMQRARSMVIFIKNIEAMDRMEPTKDVIFLLDINVPGVDHILKHANATGKFRNPYRWLITGFISNAAFPPDIFNNIDIIVDSEVIVSRGHVNNTVILNLVYKISKRRNWNLEYFGTWKENEGLSIPETISSTSIAIRRKNLHQEHIRTGTINTGGGKTPCDFESTRNALITIPTVASYWQIRHIFDFINASHELIIYDTWGQNHNGTWSGMVGGMASGEVEISAILMLVTKERMEVISYLSKPVLSQIMFVFREPRLSYQNNLFLLPFRANVWYSIIGFTVLIILVLYLSSLWEFKKDGRDESSADNGTWLEPDISGITIFAFSAITQQGSPSELKGGLGRFVIYILLLICLFLYTSYSASIVVLLQSSSNQIRTLSDLLNSKLELGVEDTEYNKQYFTTVTEPVRAAIYNTKVAPKGMKSNFMTIDEGARKLQKEAFAFHMFTPTGYRVINSLFLEHEKCGLREIAYIDAIPPWFNCKKTSHFKEMFKVGFYRLNEHGIFSRVSNLFYARKPVCAVRGGNFVSVDIVDFYPALLVLIYGALGSCFLLAVELLVFRRTKGVVGTRNSIL